jgi:hypothetical protein
METWQKVLAIVVICAFLWLAVTNAIFQLSNPEVTQTQAMLHFFKTVTLDFKP